MTISTYTPITNIMVNTQYAPIQQTFNPFLLNGMNSSMPINFNFGTPFSLPVTPQGATSITGGLNPLQVAYNTCMSGLNSFMPSLSNFSFTNFMPFDTGVFSTFKNIASSACKAVGNFASRLVSNAKKYLGHNEKDGSYKKFTGGRKEAWCADFVSYVARESGLSGFNFPSVQGILNWGRNNGKFSHNAKVGDVVIFKNGGRSHTGIVTSVNNGKITTIEGNTSDKVGERSYSLNDRTITGFVTLA